MLEQRKFTDFLLFIEFVQRKMRSYKKLIINSYSQLTCKNFVFKTDKN